MRRLIAPLVLVIGLFAGTGSATAAPPTPNDPSIAHFQCPDFMVDATGTGSSKTMDWFNHRFHDSKNTPVITATGVATTVTYTSVTPTPKSVTYKLNGTYRMAIQWNPFDLVFKSTGWNVMYVQPGYGTPGLFLSVGQVTWTEFGPAYPNGGMTGPGKITDICQVLAP